MAIEFLQPLYAILMLFSTAVGGYLIRYRDRPGAISLSVMLFAAAGWSGTLFLQTITGLFWTRNLYPVIGFCGAVGVVGTLVFAIDYCGYRSALTTRRLALLAAYPPVIALVSAVNPSNLFFTRGYTADTVVGYHYEWGPLFGVNAVFTYVLYLTAIIVLFRFVARFSRRMYRGQAVALIIGNLAPFLAGIPTVAGYTTVDVTPVGFFVATTAYAVAVTQYRLADLTPVGRDKVLDSLENGILVIDNRERVVDYNEAALSLLDELHTTDPIGDPARRLFEDHPELRDVYEQVEITDDSSLYSDGGPNSTDNTPVHEVELAEASLQIRVQRIATDHPLDQRTVITLEDISLQKRRERQLRQQVEQLDQFTSIISHDLRNPLSVAHGYIEQTEETGDLAYLNQSKAALDRMDGMIDDMLAVARQGQDAAEPVPVPVRVVATDAWDHVETQQMTLDVRTDSVILADPGQLRQLFENLFRNAKEHAASPKAVADDHGTAVTVTVDTQSHPGSTVTLIVADDGVGLPDDDLENLFDSSYTTGGNGFGLMIVRQIANAHGWSVAASNGDDGGAEFRFTHVRDDKDDTKSDPASPFSDAN